MGVSSILGTKNGSSQIKKSTVNGVSRAFDYSKDYSSLNLRDHPEFYRVGKGEQGVLLVEPYKGEILPYWKFKTPEDASTSSKKVLGLFKGYKKARDFVGMDMARKFLQMGFTRARRYANHSSGKKYDSARMVLPLSPDPVKAQSAEIFKKAWDRAEADVLYSTLKSAWKKKYG